MLKTPNIITQKTVYQLFKTKPLCAALVLFMFYSCGGIKSGQKRSITNSPLKKKFYATQFTGVLVVDPKSRDTLFAFNPEKYFTPASTVKIFTLYTGLQLLPERIPALKSILKQDTLYVQGTGDPSWLHPHFKDRTGIAFLNTHKNIALNLDNLDEVKFGPGWAWEDYAYYFSPERSALPLYGNVVTLYETDSLCVSPAVFKKHVLRKTVKNNRALHSNTFYVPRGLTDTLTVPYRTNAELTQQLLSTHLTGNLRLTSYFPQGKKEILKGIPTDSIYKQMLVESDNFLAEQLMLSASSMLSDTLSFKRSRDTILSKYLSKLSTPPRWVDGSGLSRYNLFTPASMTTVLTRLLQEVPKERLFALFPIWTEEGSKPYHPNENQNAFLHAKSGSMGNIYNLCGFLITKKGRLLVFSFMNNHFRTSTQEVKHRMFNFLREMHERY